jgi:hypothetical protein
MRGVLHAVVSGVVVIARVATLKLVPVDSGEGAVGRPDGEDASVLGRWVWCVGLHSRVVMVMFE